MLDLSGGRGWGSLAMKEVKIAWLGGKYRLKRHFAFETSAPMGSQTKLLIVVHHECIGAKKVRDDICNLQRSLRA